jgi:uncharacterized membrane protein YqjE
MTYGSTSIPLLESARRLGTTALDIAETRLAMLAMDLQEVAYRLGRLIIWGLIGVFCLGLGLALITLLVIAYYWDSHRLVAIGIGGGLFLTASILIALMIGNGVRRHQNLFALTLAELTKDRDRLDAAV